LLKSIPGTCSGIVATSTNIILGTLASGNYCYQTFNGKIDDMRIYDYALNTDEVAQLYEIPEPASVCLFSVIGLILRKIKNAK